MALNSAPSPERNDSVATMIRHLLLDFDRTLNDSDYVYEKNLDGFFGLSGQEVLQHWEEIHRRILAKEPREKHEDLDHHYELMLERWRKEDPETMKEELKKRIKAAQEECWDATELFEEAIPFLNRVKDAGHTLHIATGDYARQKADAIERQGGRVYFDWTFDEGVLGVGKGKRAYFDQALQKLGVAPREALVIGDSLVNDIGPATKAGISAIWVRRKEEKQRKSVEPDVTVTTLMEALDVPAPVGRDSGWWLWRRTAERVPLVQVVPEDV